MGVTPGKKSPKNTPKHKSPAVSEPMETATISPEKKTAIAVSQKTITPKSVTLKSPSNGSGKKSDSKSKKSLKRKLADVDYEENADEVKNLAAVIAEEDLSDSLKESSKKQKKKKQKIDTEEANRPSDDARKAGLSSGDDKEDAAEGNIPSECRLFVTGLGLDGMAKPELRDYFKSHGYCLVQAIKQIKSRHAFVGFATEKEAERARVSLDKIDCRGFPLSIDSRDHMLSSLLLMKRKKSAPLINKEGSADCILYVSPLTSSVTKRTLMDSFVGVVLVTKKGRKKNWARLECMNSTVAKELHRSHQGKKVEGTVLKLETTEEFRKRITEEENERTRQLRKKIASKKETEKKQKETEKLKEKPKHKPKASSDSEEEVDGDDNDEDGVRVVNDDGDSEEEEVSPKAKKAKVARKR